MKGLILSGGRGTRLRPLTHTSAKQLVPVANKPILFYAIECIREAGIDEIGVIVGDTREEIQRACGDGSTWGVKLTYIHQAEPLGLAHAVKTAQPFLQDDPFVMYLGDNLVKDGIVPLVREFETDRPNAQILLAHVKNPQDFGVAELEGDHIVRLVEKPKHPKSDLALVGVYMFDSHIWEAVDAIRPSARGEFEITDAIQYLIDHGYIVRSHIIGGWWKDTGKLDDMLEANRILLEDIEPHNEGTVDETSRILGRVVIGPGTQILRSEVRGPVIIGANCLIEDAYIGPFTSLYDGVRVIGSEVEHSMILENSAILNLGNRVEDSLIGKNVEVRRVGRKPRAYRLMLGDNSEVSIP
jgi:glucose-1-phosphate thymidylyltransferase